MTATTPEKVTPYLNAPPSATPAFKLHKSGNGATSATNSQLPISKPIDIRVELWLELIDTADKYCPAFAHLSPDYDPFRIVVAINRYLWPSAEAVARSDGNALKWLVALAITDRILTWRRHPVLRSIGDYLARLVGCPQEFKRGIWCAYMLREAELLSSIPTLLTSCILPAKFAEFSVSVDSARLEEFRAKMAKRLKRQRPQVETAKNEAFAEPR